MSRQAARLFGGWAMASARFTPELASTLDALMTRDRLSGDEVTALLRQVVTDQ